MTHAPPPPTLVGAPPAHPGEVPLLVPSPEAQARSTSTEGAARIVALEGDISTLKGTVNQMAANIAELMALLRAPNRTSSNFTSPPGYGPMVDPNPWVPPTHAPEGIEALAIHAPTDHPANVPPPSVTLSAAIPLPPLDSTTLEPPPMSIPIPAPVYAAPPPMYKYCAETPPTLLELSTMEMVEDQGFQAYAVKWRARAGKHVPPISEAQQIQLFHSTLTGAYYLHLLAHTSSFSSLIDAGKKLDMGIKLGKIEGSTGIEGQPLTLGVPPSAQRAPTLQPRQGGQARTRLQYPPLPVPQSQVHCQLLAAKEIRPVAPHPQFNPTNQDQNLHCEYHMGALGHTTDDCYTLRGKLQEMIEKNRLSFNEVKPPNVQANSLPDHGSSSDAAINLIDIFPRDKDKAEEEKLIFP
ncbi:hypothetical protein CRG98_039173 [Punica granatum]|uniref:Uncharacterized protein n=1 Tax=Punica granatum TaxID=22663 RepID=A0A2I0I9F4_PUNGR|nr:hypothetical protein CRG98_039173 [Punica granatum]